MRPEWSVLAFPAVCLLLACSGPGASGRFPDGHGGPKQTELADEDQYVPGYGKPELQRALIGERGAEATAERIVADLEAKPDRDIAADDRLRVAAADLAVRRRFIKSLEACEASGRWCPPRLDDPPFAFDPDNDKHAPPLDAPLAFTIDGWRKLTAELHGRACACRTLHCVDAVDAAANELEARTPPAVTGDESATLAVTRARECLFRLRGRDLRAFRALPAE
ncbi:MAG: hypothetical protein KF773_29955 [Deltaproteobacteria bacterium]|nr:hypothetical protein [Deltaproteobacteria bacterium]